jgi:hypothetical protein
MCDDHAMESGASKRSEVRFLVFSASLRESSLNTRLADSKDAWRTEYRFTGA